MSEETPVSENQAQSDEWAAALEEQTNAEAAGKEDDPWAAALEEQSAAEAGTVNDQADPVPTQKLSDDASPKHGKELNLDMVLELPVDISMEIGRTKISIRNLLQLSQGSVIELDRLAGEPMDVLVNDTLIAHGEVVVVNDKFGIRLTDVISPDERIRKLR